jgi:beta-glucanase (GH16 family)
MLKRKITCLLITSLLALCISTVALADWADEFDSGLSNWNIQTGAGGWGNAELQTYGTSNVTVSGGQLIITANRNGNSFTSGRINTQGKFSFQYGTIEAVITVPNLANGLWPAFWMMGNSGGWPNCGELDIIEMGSAAAISAGKVNQRVGSAAHWENGGSHASYSLTSDSGGGTKTLQMVWTSTMIKTYINGGQIWAFDISGGAGSDLEEFVSWPFYILLNMAVGGNYTGITSASGITAPFPAQMKVDYVRVTGTGGSTTTTASSTTTTASSTTTTASSTTTTASSTSTTASSTSTTASGSTTTTSGGGGVTTIQAENWSSMSGVATEACSEGGLNVGWIETGDWMAYNVTISTAKSYLFSFRVASPNSGTILRVDYNAGANVVGQATIPNTGGWQNWQTCTMTGNLPAGSINLGINAVSGGWNINWFSYQ